MTAVEAVGFEIDDPNTRYAPQMTRTCLMMRLPTRGMILVGEKPMLRGHGICLDGLERRWMWMILGLWVAVWRVC